MKTFYCSSLGLKHGQILYFAHFSLRISCIVRGSVNITSPIEMTSSVLYRSELIQLVAVTHKRVESSYRELIEQEIQNYQRRYIHLQYDLKHIV